MTCPLCRREFPIDCFYDDAESARLHCETCDAALVMSGLGGTLGKSGNASRPKDGMTIERMLMRIWSHQRFVDLACDVREQLAQIGRFDRRRSTDDNNYVRQVWQWMTNSVKM